QAGRIGIDWSAGRIGAKQQPPAMRIEIGRGVCDPLDRKREPLVDLRFHGLRVPILAMEALGPQIVKPLPLRRSIPVEQTRWQNALERRIRQKGWAEEIPFAV